MALVRTIIGFTGLVILVEALVLGIVFVAVQTPWWLALVVMVLGNIPDFCWVEILRRGPNNLVTTPLSILSLVFFMFSDRGVVFAGLIGATVIALAYSGLVYLGASYTEIINGVPPTEMLPTLTQHLLGKYSTVVIALAMGFSCLATATALNSLYASFLQKLFNLSSSKFPYLGKTTSLSTRCSFLCPLYALGLLPQPK